MTDLNYPSNSQKSRESQNDISSPKTVISGTARIKENQKRKFLSYFIPDDVRDVKNYILRNVVIPSLQNMVIDAVCALFGQNKPSGNRSNVGASRVSYTKYYDNSNKSQRSSVSAHPESEVASNFEDIVFNNRGDAELVLQCMWDRAVEYDGVVNVNSMYDLAGITLTNYQYGSKFGWDLDDLRSAKIVRSFDNGEYGYIINLPKARVLRD